MNYPQFLAALCLWREARGSSTAALNAIWHVILNRTTDPLNRWPKNIVDVILQPLQFSSFNHNDPNSQKWPRDNMSPDGKAWIACQDVVQNSLGGDPTNGATNYESCTPETMPKWATDNQDKITTVIGPFRFYKL